MQSAPLASLSFSGLDLLIIRVSANPSTVLQNRTDMITPGYEASLGILSAWEPCGGILCANLPIVYGVLVRAAKKVKATGYRSDQKTGSKSGYQRHSDQSLYRDWSRQNHSGRVADESGEAKQGPSRTEVDTAVTEMDTFHGKKNMEYHDLEEDG